MKRIIVIMATLLLSAGLLTEISMNGGGGGGYGDGPRGDRGGQGGGQRGGGSRGGGPRRDGGGQRPGGPGRGDGGGQRPGGPDGPGGKEMHRLLRTLFSDIDNNASLADLQITAKKLKKVIPSAEMVQAIQDLNRELLDQTHKLIGAIVDDSKTAKDSVVVEARRKIKTLNEQKKSMIEKLTGGESSKLFGAPQSLEASSESVAIIEEVD